MDSKKYSFETAFGIFQIVYKAKDNKSIIYEIILPNKTSSNKKDYAPKEIIEFSKKIIESLEGKNVEFDIKMLNFDGMTEFQRKVLKSLLKIKKGENISYSNLGKLAGFERAARAVGSVMAKNPFPIVIPCHRVVKSDGRIGNYGGGIDMKMKLLEMEKK